MTTKHPETPNQIEKMKLKVFQVIPSTPSFTIACFNGVTHLTIRDQGTPNESIVSSAKCDGSCVQTTLEVPDNDLKSGIVRNLATVELNALLKPFNKGQLFFSDNGKSAIGTIESVTAERGLFSVNFSETIRLENPSMPRGKDDPVIAGTWQGFKRDCLHFKVESLAVTATAEQKSDIIEAELLNEAGQAIMRLKFVHKKSCRHGSLTDCIGTDLVIF